MPQTSFLVGTENPNKNCYTEMNGTTTKDSKC